MWFSYLVVGVHILASRREGGNEAADVYNVE